MVIESMSLRNSSTRPELIWEVANVTASMRYPNNYFDIVIDKSTMDAILCGDSSFMMMAKMMKEVQRVLKEESGAYLGVSYGTPEHRLLHYKRPHLKFAVSTFKLAGGAGGDPGKEVPAAGVHYAYVCRKLEGADLMSEERWTEVEEAIRLEEQAEEDVMDDTSSIENDEEKELKEGEEIMKKAAEDE